MILNHLNQNSTHGIVTENIGHKKCTTQLWEQLSIHDRDTENREVGLVDEYLSGHKCADTLCTYHGPGDGYICLKKVLA